MADRLLLVRYSRRGHEKRGSARVTNARRATTARNLMHSSCTQFCIRSEMAACVTPNRLVLPPVKSSAETSANRIAQVRPFRSS